MIDRFVVDTSAVVDFMRRERPKPPLMLGSAEVFLPLNALGELYVGALSTRRPESHLHLLHRVSQRWTALAPDVATARIYGELRVRAGNIAPISPSKSNDFWIAALCVQHNLPLLTNDRGFDRIEGLTVIHW
jgi:tRNA(fMet)-specific endonuclease VapC